LSPELNILQEFEPIGLSEMERVKLMNRTDTKFLFSVDQFEEIMKEIKDHYRVLVVNDQRANRYRTLYYDTSDLGLYIEHHNKKLNRYKIRHRTYVESNTGFLEVKFKNNKGRTQKKRIEKPEPPLEWEGENVDFLNKTQPYDPNSLQPTIWVNYIRYTLVHKTEPERLTIDVDLEFVKNDVTKKLEGLVIAELKQEKRHASPFFKMMKKLHIREGGLSKYCLGIALTCDNIKRNSFKEKLLKLKHLIHYDPLADGR
jgi:hypothetical protein